jgi:hypothetical protein
MDKVAKLRTLLLAWARGAASARLNRPQFALEVLAFAAGIGVLLVPFATYLWTAPQVARELYVVVALCLGLTCLLGIFYAYMRRLVDAGLNRIFAPVLIMGLPTVLIWAAYEYGNAQFVAAMDANRAPPQVNDYIAVALVASLIAAVLPAMRRSKALVPQAEVKPSAWPLRLFAVCAGVATTSAVYSGHVQDGVWVGRQEFSFNRGFQIPADGRVIATCSNSKGVTAISQEGEPGDGGFVRDAVGGTWNLVLLPDGRWDLRATSDTQQVSYLRDGFVIEVKGARLQQPYGFFELARDVDRFVVLASSYDADFDPSGSSNVTTLTFTRLDYGWRANIAASSSHPKGGIFGQAYPRGSSYLMLADCAVRQPYVERER